GLDVDLNIAMKEAVRETIALLQAKAGVTAAEAYAIASMGVDFRVAEAVDSMLLVYGVVPKRDFKQNPEYWGGRERNSLPPGNGLAALINASGTSDRTLRTPGLFRRSPSTVPRTGS